MLLRKTSSTKLLMPWPGNSVILAFALLLYPYIPVLALFFLIYIKYAYI